MYCELRFQKCLFHILFSGFATDRVNTKYGNVRTPLEIVELLVGTVLSKVLLWLFGGRVKMWLFAISAFVTISIGFVDFMLE